MGGKRVTDGPVSHVTGWAAANCPGPHPTFFDWNNTPWQCARGCGSSVAKLEGPPARRLRKAGR